MNLGRLARRFLGSKGFALAGAVYRRVFVDLDKVVEAIGSFGEAQRLLDVGGGDGVLLNLLLARHPTLHVTLVDAARGAGTQIRPEYRARVEVLEGTSLASYAQSRPAQAPDAVLVSDVMHHVPPAQRGAFLRDLAAVLDERPVRLLVKDMEPGHFRTTLGGLADRYVSGDRGVQFLTREELRRLVADTFPAAKCRETNLFRTDPPNYCLEFSLPSPASLTESPGVPAP